MHREETKERPRNPKLEDDITIKLEDDITIWKTRRYELNSFNEETSLKFEHDCKHRKG